jgi:sorbitol-6-phosphate 2-dehydrogenase
MHDEAIRVIAPLLRGLTFDGEKGAFVSWSPSELAGARRAELPKDKEGAVDLSVSAVLPVLTHVFSESEAEEIQAIFLPGAGSFSLKFPTPRGEGREATVREKIALVTGAAQGFGAELAAFLAAAGCYVFIADLNAVGAERVSEEVNETAGKKIAWPLAVDVADEKSVEDMFTEVVKKAGGLDLFVSNAGVLRAGGVGETALRDFRLVTDINYVGYFLGAKHASRIMRLQNVPSGNYYTDIVQINSKSGLEGSNRNSAYAGSKFGGIGLTQSFALELVEYNIKVNAICPGNFYDGPLWSDPVDGLFAQYLRSGKVPGAKTVGDVRGYYESKTPMKRGCVAADVMKALLYVIDQKYETGQAVPVTGGQVMLG